MLNNLEIKLSNDSTIKKKKKRDAFKQSLFLAFADVLKKKCSSEMSAKTKIRLCNKGSLYSFYWIMLRFTSNTRLRFVRFVKLFCSPTTKRWLIPPKNEETTKLAGPNLYRHYILPLLLHLKKIWHLFPLSYARKSFFLW